MFASNQNIPPPSLSAPGHRNPALLSPRPGQNICDQGWGKGSRETAGGEGQRGRPRPGLRREGCASHWLSGAGVRWGHSRRVGTWAVGCGLQQTLGVSIGAAFIWDPSLNPRWGELGPRERCSEPPCSFLLWLQFRRVQGYTSGPDVAAAAGPQPGHLLLHRSGCSPAVAVTAARGWAGCARCCAVFKVERPAVCHPASLRRCPLPWWGRSASFRAAGLWEQEPRGLSCGCSVVVFQSLLVGAVLWWGSPHDGFCLSPFFPAPLSSSCLLLSLSLWRMRGGSSFPASSCLHLRPGVCAPAILHPRCPLWKGWTPAATTMVGPWGPAGPFSPAVLAPLLWKRDAPILAFWIGGRLLLIWWPIWPQLQTWWLQKEWTWGGWNGHPMSRTLRGCHAAVFSLLAQNVPWPPQGQAHLTGGIGGSPTYILLVLLWLLCGK